MDSKRGSSFWVFFVQLFAVEWMALIFTAIVNLLGL
ncbi:hypothetical protein ACUXHY_005344 [Cytobacillus horneckiae]